MAVLTKVQLKARIDETITSNGNREITGALMNALLSDIIDSLKHKNS